MPEIEEIKTQLCNDLQNEYVTICKIVKYPKLRRQYKLNLISIYAIRLTYKSVIEQIKNCNSLHDISVIQNILLSKSKEQCLDSPSKNQQLYFAGVTIGSQMCEECISNYFEK